MRRYKMEDKTAIIEERSVYGQTRLYPMNETALLIAKLAGSTTITHDIIRHAKALGYSFKTEAVVKEF